MIDGSKRKFMQVKDVRSFLDSVLAEDIQNLFADGARQPVLARMLL
jgi:hypothetical protein